MKIFSHLVKSKEFNLLVPRYATPKEEGSQQQQKKNQKRIYPFWLKSSLNQKKNKKKKKSWNQKRGKGHSGDSNGGRKRINSTSGWQQVAAGSVDNSGISA